MVGVVGVRQWRVQCSELVAVRERPAGSAEEGNLPAAADIKDSCRAAGGWTAVSWPRHRPGGANYLALEKSVQLGFWTL